MKIQCPCGAKYAFDVTPDMGDGAFRLVCSQCQTDLSAVVQPLIQQALAEANSPSPTAPPPSPAAPLHTQPNPAPQVRLHVSAPTTAPSPAPEAKPTPTPIPQSASLGREMHVFRYLMAATVSLSILGIAFWAFYQFYLSQPHPVLEVTLPQSKTPPQAVLTPNGNSLLLQNGTLTSYHPKTGKVSWQLNLVDTNAIQQLAKTQAALYRAQYFQERDELRRKPRRDREGNAIRMDEEPALSQEEDALRRREQLLERTTASMTLIPAGDSVWVKSAMDFVQINTASGRPLRTLTLPAGITLEELKPSGSALRWEGLVRTGKNEARRTLVDLHSGEVNSQSFTFEDAAHEPTSSRPRPTIPGRTNPPPREIASPRAPTQGVGAVETLLRAIELKHNTELEDAMADETEIGPRKKHPELIDMSRVEVVESGSGAQKMMVKLIEFKGVVQKAIQDAPGKSVLDGGQPLAGKLGEAANEILNDLKRNRGDDVRIDDRSRYQVTLKPAEGTHTPPWSGEVQGPPQWYALQNLNIIAAGETLTVLDLQNKKLWDTQLAQPIGDLFTVGNGSELIPGSSEGAFLETSDALLVADVGAVTAFDKSKGNVLWKFSSVNTTSMIRDGHGALYLNTTTAGQDMVQFSHQVDVRRKVKTITVKLDERSGKVVWKAEAGGHLGFLKDGLLYVVDSGDHGTGIPRTTIARIHPATGKVVWEFTQAGSVFHVGFQDRAIQTLSEKELTVYRYWTF